MVTRSKDRRQWNSLRRTKEGVGLDHEVLNYPGT